MKEIFIQAALDKVDFAPASELVEIIQNVKTILTTIKFTVPLDREFGLDTRLLDSPLPVAQAKLTAEIVEAIKFFEPRFKVTEVTYAGEGADGRLLPTVRGELR